MSGRLTLALLASATLIPAIAAAESEWSHRVGPGSGTLSGSIEGGCGTLFMTSDGTYEDGYTWGGAGIVPPDFGAFAECIPGPVRLCSVVADLTRINELGFPVDVFVYNDGGGVPGAVIASSLDNDPGPVGFWPTVTRHVFAIDVPCADTQAPVYVGVFWDDLEGPNELFIAADLDGFGGGCPLTNIAPGIGYPTGWNNVSVVWGTARALGIGAETLPCDPVPVETTSWGQIKSLF